MMKKVLKSLFLTLVMLGLTHGYSQNIYVDAGVTTTGDGSQGSPFKTISEGVGYANANAVDTIHVAAGTYSNTYSGGTNQKMNLTRDGVVLFGENPNTTVVQLGGGEKFLEVTANLVEIHNLQIVGQGGSSYKGAIHLNKSTATADSTYALIESCFFDSNANDIGFTGIGNGGGAIQARNSTGAGVVLTVRNSQFANNQVSGSGKGGDIYVGTNNHLNLIGSRSTCASTSFVSDDGYHSGGSIALVNASAKIDSSQVLNGTSGDYGGGLYANSSSARSVIITNTVFAGNSSRITRGGGVFLEDNITMQCYNVLFYENECGGGFGDGGGAVAIYKSGGSSRAIFVNCTFADNIARNGSDRGAINNEDGAQGLLMNCIIRGNTNNGWNGSFQSVTNLQSNPTFVDAANDDYRLNTGSSGIDAGTASYLWGATTFSAPSSDITEFSRTATPDIGAFEFGAIALDVDQTCAIIIDCVNLDPSGSANQSFCAIDGATVNDLTVSAGATVVWYDAPGGSVVQGTTALSNGDVLYAVDETVGCDPSGDFEVTISVNDATVPGGNASQDFCTIDGATVADLVATGTGLTWYTDNTMGTALTGTEALVDGEDYYVTSNDGTCESSTGLTVTVGINDATVPGGNANQDFCTIDGATVADLVATGAGLTWYTDNTMGTALTGTEALVDGEDYYVTSNDGTCESSTGLTVTVGINDATVPGGNANQDFCTIDGATVADLVATGAGLTWYTDNTMGTALTGTEALVDGEDYYVTSNDGTCESSTGLTVTVGLVDSPSNITDIVTDEVNCLTDDGSVQVNADDANEYVLYDVTGVTELDRNTTGLFTDLASGDYVVEVFNNAGGQTCGTNTHPVTIGGEQLPTVQQDVAGNVGPTSCGAADGAIGLTGIADGTYTVSYQDQDNNTFQIPDVAVVGGAYQITGLASGVYTVFTVTDQTTNCTSDPPITVTLTDPLAPAVTVASNTAICEGEEITLNTNVSSGSITWSDNLGNTYGEGDVISPTESITLTATVSDMGCVGTASFDVTIHPAPVIGITRDKDTICFGDDLILTGTGGGDYAWSTGETTQSITISPVDMTLYQLVVTDVNGCDGDTVIRITVVDQPSLTFVNGDPAALCDGEEVLIEVVANGEVTWHDGSTGSTYLADGSVPVVTATVGSLCGNTLTDQINVALGSSPVVDAGPDGTMEEDEDYQIDGTVSNADTIYWSPELGLSCSDCEDPLATPTETTVYYLNAISADGCPAYDSVIVTVTPDSDIWWPNAITGDGGTDCCFSFTTGIELDDYYLRIYNRWGELMFESRDQQEVWNGSFRGQLVQTGVYTFVMDYTDAAGETQRIGGNITVVK